MKINFNTYGWINNVPNKPKILQEIIRIGKLNTNEIPGPKSNAEIMQLAKIAKVSDIYKNDDVAWCAMAMAAILELIGKPPVFTGWNRLRALSFKDYGVCVNNHDLRLGDIVTFSRTGGGHVGVLIAKDKLNRFHVAGGNQSNTFNIAPIDMSRAVAFRRPNYNIIPGGCILLPTVAPTGQTSRNEA